MCPDAIMCDSFRCSYAPRLNSFGIESKTIPVPCNSSTIVDYIFLEVYKFRNEDFRRIFSCLKRLEDISEEAVAMRIVEKILEKRQDEF